MANAVVVTEELKAKYLLREGESVEGYIARVTIEYAKDFPDKEISGENIKILEHWPIGGELLKDSFAAMMQAYKETRKTFSGDIIVAMRFNGEILFFDNSSVTYEDFLQQHRDLQEKSKA